MFLALSSLQSNLSKRISSIVFPPEIPSEKIIEIRIERSSGRIRKNTTSTLKTPQSFFFFFITVSSYNQPKFSECATWNPKAITFTNSTTVGTNPNGIYVDINNTVYAVAYNLNQVSVWLEGNMTPARTISGGFSLSFTVVALVTGDIYIDNGAVNYRVVKWSWETTTSVTVMNVTSRCISLFIDHQQTLYCSQDKEHKIVKMSLTSGSNTPTIAAGNGTNGSEAHLLSSPKGIFVDKHVNLYVADFSNNRIQLFQSGELNATTVAGNGAPGTITLNGPIAVTLDADGYLFISDYANNRIIRSGPFGFQCLLGCSGVAGAASNQLNGPHALSFDSYGNIFVADRANNRIQKFLLATNSCGKHLLPYCRMNLFGKFSKNNARIFPQKSLSAMLDKLCIRFS